MLKRLSLIVLVLALLCTACPVGAEVVFAFDSLSYTVNVGKTLELSPILQGAQLPEKAKYQWESSDKGVLTVSAKGVVTGKGAGEATVTCSVVEKEEVLYTTSCQVIVKQPIKSIKPEEEVLYLPISPSRDLRQTYQLNPIVKPDNADGELIYSTDSNQFSVTSDGLIKTTTDISALLGKKGTVVIEANDGSGVKAKQSVMVLPYMINLEELEINERGNYRLMYPTWSEYMQVEFYQPNIKYDKEFFYVEKLIKIDGWQTSAGFGKNAISYFDIRPLKAGTTTITFTGDYYTFPGIPTFKLKVRISEDACYTKKNHEKLNYKNTMADPEAMTGKPVYFKGKYEEERVVNGKTLYAVSVDEKAGNVVLLRFPDKVTPDVVKGKSYTFYGTLGTPHTQKTETGLTLSTLILDVNRMDNIVYSNKTVEVDLYLDQQEMAALEAAAQ